MVQIPAGKCMAKNVILFYFIYEFTVEEFEDRLVSGRPRSLKSKINTTTMAASLALKQRS